MLGDFTVKTQNWEGKSVFYENQLGRNEIWCMEDYHSNLCNISAKKLLDLNFK